MTDKQEEKELPDFKDVENGPMSEANRECRDVFCCLIFLANIVAMIYLTFYAYLHGNTYYIYRGTSGAYICGQSAETVNHPFMYMYNPIPFSGTFDASKRVCVDKCPTMQNGALTTFSCFPAVNGCSYSYTYNAEGNGSSIFPPTASDFIGYPSTTELGRVCVPEVKVFSQGLDRVVNSTSSQVAAALQQGYLGDFISDVKNNWYYLLAALGFAIIISFIYMFLLRCFVGCIVWGSIIGILVLLIGLGVVFLYNGGVIPANDYTGYLGIPTLATSQYYHIYGYVMFGIAGLLLIILLCCCNRIRLAVAICKSAGQFVVGVYLIILVPVVMTILSLLMWAACLTVMVYLVSSATFVSNSSDFFSVIADYTERTLLQFYYFVFATLWCNAMINAIATFVIASACCMWYYSHAPGQDLDSPILRSYKMVFRYHFGSLAFGAFILALVQFLQFLVEVFKKHAEATGQDRAPCFQYVLNCVRCCLACVERIVQFLNKTAYIQIALRGKNFCMAAKDGFEIVWSNGLRYAIVGGVGEIVMFLGKLLIAIATTVGFYCLITFVDTIKAGYLEPLLQLLLVFVIAYLVAMVFMSVYSVAMDALLACFIVDELNQKAKGGKAAVYAPQELAGLMDTD